MLLTTNALALLLIELNALITLRVPSTNKAAARPKHAAADCRKPTRDPFN
jgi:hypothetical protein